MEVFESERATGYNNRSLAWLMNDKGVFTPILKRQKIDTINNRVIEDILEVYFRLCSIEVDCDDLARFAAVLANGGKSIGTSEDLIPSRHVTIATAMIASSGLYDGSGEFAYSTGIPAKTGVSGGIVGVVPGKCGIAAYSPIIDEKGNTYRGQKILEEISRTEDLSIFIG
jgi:glutaminase